MHHFVVFMYYVLMNAWGVAGRGPTLVELDERASEPEKPFGIITVDCTSPREIDDGVLVEPLPSANELYKVRVFTVDTSDLYSDEQVARTVIEKTEARYLNPQADTEAYEPMLDKEIIGDLEFAAGSIRKALVVSFNIGPSQPPADISVGYGKVEVLKNFRYDKFGKKCRYNEAFESYGRAAALILKHLKPAPLDEEEAYAGLIHVPKSGVYRRGADINQAFMIAANYHVARIMSEEKLAIFRTHDLQDETFRELMNPNVARFSTHPAPHDGLGLDMYTRVTSPLRRAEDFMMHGLLRARHEGRAIDRRDRRLVTTAVQRLNQRVVVNVFHGRLQMNDEDLWMPDSTNESEQLAS